MKQDKDLYESWAYDYTETNQFDDSGRLKVGSLLTTFVICPKQIGRAHV